MSKGRILIIEDNMDNYELVRFFLERYGYETFLAATGAEGVQAALKQLPDLALVDLALPLMDGWDVSRRIKSDPRTAHIPLIAVTARTQLIDRQRALEAGCEDYIPKPIDFSTLLIAVERAIQKTRRTQI